MELNQYDLYAYQILHYLVIQKQYQVVRVEQCKDDLWVMNALQDKYPVIRISSKSNAGTLSDTDYIRNVHRLILNLIHREGPMMILNTNPDSLPIENDTLTQVRITQDAVSDEGLLATFAELGSIIHSVEDPQQELIQLSKEVEEAQLKRRKELLDRTAKKRVPKLTIAVILLCVVYALAALVLTVLIQDINIATIAAGGYYKMNVVAAHEYFRLVTSGFLHTDMISLCFNMYALYLIGKYVEQLFTKGEYLLILLTSIIVGNLCMLIGSPNGIGMGIGGGIFGLTGAYLCILIKNGTIRHPVVKLSLMPILIAAFFTMLLPGISIQGHIGALASGVLLGILLDKHGRYVQLRRHAGIAGTIFLAGLLFLGFSVQRVEPLAPEVDGRIVAVYHNTPMEAYGKYLERCYQAQYEKE